MLASYQLLLLLLFCTAEHFSYAFSAPRTLRSGSSRSASLFQGDRRRTNHQNASLLHNSSSIVYSSGVSVLSQMTTQMDSSAIERQYPSKSLTVPGWGEKVCGSRTQNVGYWGDQDLEMNLFNFTEYCSLWNSSCPGNKSVALGMYSPISFLILSRIRLSGGLGLVRLS